MKHLKELKGKIPLYIRMEEHYIKDKEMEEENMQKQIEEMKSRYKSVGQMEVQEHVKNVEKWYRDKNL